jgi:hypothetical protein
MEWLADEFHLLRKAVPRPQHKGKRGLTAASVADQPHICNIH